MSILTTGTGSAQHALSKRGDDLYETPPEATRALLAVESLPHRIWEPACGRLAIVNVLRAAGHEVFASDIRDYGCMASMRDFLVPQDDLGEFPAIVTNPPFKHAADFVRLSLERAPLVILLLRLAFLESERRRPILDNGTLARVHVFRNRLPMMHRDGWTGNKVSNPTAFAWFVWDRSHTGPTTLNRISWEAA